MNITVLCGGLSSERDVSLTSGLNCAKALSKKGHNVFLLDVFMGTETPAEKAFTEWMDFSEVTSSIAADAPDLEAIKNIRGESPDGFFGKNVIDICKKSDIVFMALHGANGEDGRIQATFDLMGIKYTGCNYLGSANAMNKSITRRLLIGNGITMAKGTHYTGNDFKSGKTDEWTSFPCIVKPCCGGSSLGVSKAENRDEFNSALKACFRFEDEAVVEEFVSGREFSIGVIDGKALPVIEIIADGFYDYKNKYSGRTREVCPAETDAETTAKLQAAAEKAFEALNLSVYARIDFILSSENGKPYCLEANTLPGMTPASLLPQEARAVGIEYPDLCELIINKSLERF
ncbi:MAG: D-alanine--D-alanine ligase [Oscillospiraceae bacterium]|nr:D-alanine--D-alanine ligase [Oscillospiraceae bacterium]